MVNNKYIFRYKNNPFFLSIIAYSLAALIDNTLLKKTWFLFIFLILAFITYDFFNFYKKNKKDTQTNTNIPKSHGLDPNHPDFKD